MYRKIIEGLTAELDLTANTIKLFDCIRVISQKVSEQNIAAITKALEGLTEQAASGSFFPNKAHVTVTTQDPAFTKLCTILGPLTTFFTEPTGNITLSYEKLTTLPAVIAAAQALPLLNTQAQTHAREYTQTQLGGHPFTQEHNYLIPTKGFTEKAKKLVLDELEKRIAFNEIQHRTEGGRGNTTHIITFSPEANQTDILKDIQKILEYAVKENPELTASINQAVQSWKETQVTVPTIAEQPSLALSGYTEALTNATTLAEKQLTEKETIPGSILSLIAPQAMYFNQSQFIKESVQIPYIEYLQRLEAQAKESPLGKKYLEQLPTLLKQLEQQPTVIPKKTAAASPDNAQQTIATASSTMQQTTLLPEAPQEQSLESTLIQKAYQQQLTQDELLTLLGLIRSTIGRHTTTDNNDPLLCRLIASACLGIQQRLPQLSQEEKTTLQQLISTIHGYNGELFRPNTPIKNILEFILDQEEPINKDLLKTAKKVVQDSLLNKPGFGKSFLGIFKKAYDTLGESITRIRVMQGIKTPTGGNTKLTKENTMNNKHVAAGQEGTAENKKGNFRKTLIAILGALSLFGGGVLTGNLTSAKPAGFDKEVQDTFDNARNAITATLSETDLSAAEAARKLALNNAIPNLPESLDKDLEQHAKIVRQADALIDSLYKELAAYDANPANQAKDEKARAAEKDKMIETSLASASLSPDVAKAARKVLDDELANHTVLVPVEKVSVAIDPKQQEAADRLAAAAKLQEAANAQTAAADRKAAELRQAEQAAAAAIEKRIASSTETINAAIRRYKLYLAAVDGDAKYIRQQADKDKLNVLVIKLTTALSKGSRSSAEQATYLERIINGKEPSVALPFEAKTLGDMSDALSRLTTQ